MIKSNKDLVNYNKFLFCTEFARNLIELYIPLVLYKAGFQIKEIVLYVFFISLFSLIVSTVVTIFYHKLSDKVLVGIGGIGLLLVYVILKNIRLSTSFLILLSLAYAIYRRCYWSGKRYYTLKTMSDEKKAFTGGIIAIISQMTKLMTGIIAGLLLDKNQIMILLVVAFVMIIAGIMYLSKIDLKDEETDKIENKNVHTKVTIQELKKILSSFNASDIISLLGYEGLFIIDFFLPLYLFIYVKDQFSFIGIVNFIIGISSIIFVLLFSKNIDHSKKDYVRSMTFFNALIVVLEINFLNPVVILVLSLLRGYFTKFHFVTYVRKLWCLEDSTNKAVYNMFLELILCISRLTLATICILCFLDIKMIIYVGIIAFFMQTLFGFRNDLKL